MLLSGPGRWRGPSNREQSSSSGGGAGFVWRYAAMSCIVSATRVGGRRTLARFVIFHSVVVFGVAKDAGCEGAVWGEGGGLLGCYFAILGFTSLSRVMTCEAMCTPAVVGDGPTLAYRWRTSGMSLEYHWHGGLRGSVDVFKGQKGFGLDMGRENKVWLSGAAAEDTLGNGNFPEAVLEDTKI